MLSADNLCKQFGPRSGPTKCRAWSGSKLFNNLMVFLKEFFKKVDFEKNLQTTKKHPKLPSRQRAKLLFTVNILKFDKLIYLHSHIKCCFCYRLLTFFKINFFKKFFQEHYQSVNQLTERTSALIWVQTVWKGYQQTKKVAAGKE